MAISMIEYQLMEKFKETKIRTEMAFELISVLQKDDQQVRMIRYLEANKGNITEENVRKCAIDIIRGKR